MLDNPFEILRLDPSAPDAEIVRQAGRLRQVATEEATRNSIRQAVQSLTASTEDRALHALLAHPAPGYQSPVLERFRTAFRRPPASAGDAPTCPALDIKEFEGLVKEICVEELELPPLLFESLTEGESNDELDRQTAETLWLSLLYDPQA